MYLLSVLVLYVKNNECSECIMMRKGLACLIPKYI